MATGRPPKLKPAQLEEIAKRLMAGEKPADLAREFKVSRAFMTSHFKNKVENVRNVASQLVSAESALRALPLSEQLLAVSLADDLRAISTHMARGAKFSAASFNRLSGMANAKVEEVDDAAPLNDTSREALRDVAVLQKLANEAATVPLNLLAANKDTVKRLNEVPDPGAPDLTGLSTEELLQLEGIMGKATSAP
jgi:hypothetical protein